MSTKIFILRNVWLDTLKKFITEQRDYGIKKIWTSVNHTQKKGYYLTTYIDTEDTILIFEGLHCIYHKVILRNEKEIMQLFKNYVRSKNQKNNRKNTMKTRNSNI